MTVGEFKRRTKSFEHITDGLTNEQIEDLVRKK
jgi:hypothetical protein